MMNFKNMPKIELHVHLDGSLRVETVSELLGISIDDAIDKMVVKEDNANLNEYLTKFELPLKVMQSKKNLIRISEELARDLKADNVIYAEVRFAPMLHKKKHLSYASIIKSVLKGFKKVDGIKINIILCLMRGVSDKENLATIKASKRYLHKGVVGIDLAGAEAIYPTSLSASLFKQAKKYKLPITIHAGEAAGSDSMKAAISFGASRLGHGVRSIYDIDTLNQIKEKGITLEVCPTSNIDTKVFMSYNQHPIKVLKENGVLLTVNTDNRTVSNITLTDEYNLLASTFGFSINDFVEFNINAINASFLSTKEKAKLLEKFTSYFN